MDAVTAGTIVARAEAMEIPTVVVDGMDVRAVREAAEDAVGRVRTGDGPVLVEARTYRFVGHSRSDPGKYRPPGELEEWRERDPLLVAEQRLTADGATAEQLQGVADGVERELQEVEAAALAAPFPTETLLAEFKE
jgi:TPP-dependent pyruvate/acetoin dehydrogenase alpha subunit